MFTHILESLRRSKLTHALIKHLPLNPHQLKRKLSDNTAGCKRGGKEPLKTYNTPHPPKDPPEGFEPTVVHNAFPAVEGLPYTVFRPFECEDEVLGPDASKCGEYKNPEYYSYHRFTFAEVQRMVLEKRLDSIKNKGARCVYDYPDNEDDEFVYKPKNDGKAGAKRASNENEPCTERDADKETKN